MKALPNKIIDRLVTGIKRFKPILEDAKARDINESDTVVIVTDMLCYIFGYDKYSEITSEFAIRGTYCDLATKIHGSLQYLIEVKPISDELKENYIKQAVDYAANQGIDWVILTNGIKWMVFRVTFGKPIEKETVVEFDFLELNYKDRSHLEMLFGLSKEGCTKSILDELHIRKQIVSKYFIGSLILSDSVIKLIKKELKRIAQDVKIEEEQICEVIKQEIFKREIIDSEKTQEALKKINRASKKHLKQKKENNNSSSLQEPKEENLQDKSKYDN